MSKSKYTNTANAGRLRRRGQSVPKNLLTSEDRFIDGSYKKEVNGSAESVGHKNRFRQRFQRSISFSTSLPRVEATLGWNWRTSSAFCPSNAFGGLSLERKLNQYLFTPPQLRARCTEIRWLRCGAGIYHRAVRRVFSESM